MNGGRRWFLEVGFGPVASAPRLVTFSTLAEARTWLADRVGADPPCLRDVLPLRPAHGA